jgi:hypothetical protein
MPPNPPFVASEIPSSAKLNTLVGVYDRNTTEVDVVSSAAATSLYAPSIGAGHLSTNRMARMTILGDFLNNTGSNATFTLRVNVGGATAIDDLSNTIATSASRRAFKIVAEVANLGATNSQFVSVRIHMSGSASAGAGTGDLASPTTEVLNNVMIATTAQDSTLAMAFAVQVVLSSASASLSFRKKYALLELL